MFVPHVVFSGDCPDDVAVAIRRLAKTKTIDRANIS